MVAYFGNWTRRINAATSGSWPLDKICSHETFPFKMGYILLWYRLTAKEPRAMRNWVLRRQVSAALVVSGGRMIPFSSGWGRGASPRFRRSSRRQQGVVPAIRSSWRVSSAN
jgi:hypothetical protein